MSFSQLKVSPLWWLFMVCVLSTSLSAEPIQPTITTTTVSGVIQNSLPNCSTSVMTSLGEVLIFDEEKTYQEAVEICDDHGAILLPANSTQLINEITKNNEVAGRCVDTNEQEIYRSWYLWLIGLNIDFRVNTTWTNNQPFNYEQSKDLFIPGISLQSNICYEAVLYWGASKLQLLPKDCMKEGGKARFLCLKKPKEPEKPKKATSTPKYSPKASAVTSSEVLLIVALFAMFLIGIAIGLFVRKKREDLIFQLGRDSDNYQSPLVKVTVPGNSSDPTQSKEQVRVYEDDYTYPTVGSK